MWSSAIISLAAHVTCGLMSDLVICKRRKDYAYMALNVFTEPMGGIKKQ